MPLNNPERAALMEELARQLDDTVDRLNIALDRQAELASQVGQVRRRNRWLLGGIGLSLLVAAGSVVAALTAFNTAKDVRSLNARQERDREALTFSSCVVRNAAQLGTDARFDGMFDTLIELRPNVADVIDVLRTAGVAPIEQRYRDCDKNGVVADAGDFPLELAGRAPNAGN